MHTKNHQNLLTNKMVCAHNTTAPNSIHKSPHKAGCVVCVYNCSPATLTSMTSALRVCFQLVGTMAPLLWFVIFNNLSLCPVSHCLTPGPVLQSSIRHGWVKWGKWGTAFAYCTTCRSYSRVKESVLLIVKAFVKLLLFWTWSDSDISNEWQSVFMWLQLLSSETALQIENDASRKAD